MNSTCTLTHEKFAPINRLPPTWVSVDILLIFG